MYPYVATLEITRRCNLNCIHCFNESSLFNKYGLSTEKSYKIIDRLNGVKNLVITGGEPLLRKDLMMIANYARNRFDKLILQTNGELIPKINYDLLHCFDEIEISIYGRPNTDKKIKRGMNHSVEKSLRILKQENIPFTIATVLMSINKSEMDYLVGFSKSIGANGVRLQDFVPFGRGTEDLSVRNLESKKIKDYLRRKYEKFIRITSDYQCGGGGDVFIEIDCNGNISPCAFIKSNENLLEKELYEIIDSELFRQFKEKRNEVREIPKCQILNL